LYLAYYNFSITVEGCHQCNKNIHPVPWIRTRCTFSSIKIDVFRYNSFYRSVLGSFQSKMNRLSLKNDRSHTCPNNWLVYKIKIFATWHVLVKVQWSESVLVCHSWGDQISLSTFKDLFAVQIFFICQIQKNVVEFDNLRSITYSVKSFLWHSSYYLMKDSDNVLTR
jgi:hypothetical protein